MFRILFVCLIVFQIIIFSCTSENSNSESKEISSDKITEKDTLNHVSPPQIKIDSFNTHFAMYMGGIMPKDSNAFFNLFQNNGWQKFHDKISNDWEQVKSRRLDALQTWENTELRPLHNDTLPLFYPFSGPDFLHANSFYPNASEYYFIAIEPVVELPDPKAKNFNSSGFLNDLEYSLRDVLGKSYFITTHMQKDLNNEKADGVLPLFYAFLARTDHEIIAVYPVEIDSNGTIYTHDSLSYKKNQAVQFKFRKTGNNQVKTLTYFNRSISDRDLKNKHPEFILFLENSIPDCNTFVKAASYLMHYDGFSIIRNAVLTHSQAIFQDDTGMPLRYIDQNIWKIRLYGDYTRPIKDFSDMMYQTDLNQLYDNTPESEKYTIPFSLGYHIVGDKIQNHQIFTRK